MNKGSNKTSKYISVILLVVFVGVFTVCGPIIRNGYVMYRDAVKKCPVDVKVYEIKSRDNYIDLEDISPYFVSQVIRTEDKRFYRHPGIDVLAIIRAVKNDLLAGSFVEGGSTITQQLVKNMYFKFDKVLERKVAEVFAGFQLERYCTKDEILELYLNYIYFGEGCFGIEEAAEHYYGTLPMELTEEQADALVITIKCPEEFNPNAMAEGI